MVGEHHQFDEHEFEQAPGVVDGQGSLVCFSPWVAELDTTWQLYNNNNKPIRSNYMLCEFCSPLFILLQASHVFYFLFLST